MSVTHKHGGTFEREAELDAAIDDALVTLAFAARRGIDIGIDEATAILAFRDRNGHPSEPVAEASFWRALSAVSKRVLPATPASIRATRDLPVPRTDRTVKAYVRWSFGVLLLLAGAQTYTVVGKALVEQVTRPAQTAVGGEIESLKATGTTGNGLIPSFLPPLESRGVGVGVNDPAYNELQRWNSIWVVPAKMVLRGTRHAAEWSARAFMRSGVAHAAAEPTKKMTARESNRQELLKTSELQQRTLTRARFVIDALQRFVLPYLYGFLGACVYILRRMSVQIEESSFKSTVEFRIRRWLGGLAGVAIGLLIGADLGITPAALAFLAGYSVEVMITAMDRFVSSVSDAVGPRAATT